MKRKWLLVLVLMGLSGPASAGPSDVEIIATDAVTIGGMSQGDDAWLSIGREGPVVSRALVSFDLTRFRSNARIARAWVMLFRASAVGDSPMFVTAYRITQGWSASTATWGNIAYAEAYDTTSIHWRDEAQSPHYYWDVTELAQAWIDGSLPNYGVMLIGHEEAGDNLRRFNSRNNWQGGEPRLLIDWAPIRRVYLPMVSSN